MSYHVVVARYKENIEWLRTLNQDHVFLYDKSGSETTHAEFPELRCIYRKNIGREVESFFYHIIQQYDNLPDYLIFLQGWPFDHVHVELEQQKENLQKEIDRVIQLKPTETLPFFTELLVESHDTFIGIRSREYLQFLFGLGGDSMTFASGCQYIVPKEVLLFHSKEFYMNFHAMILQGDVFTYDRAHNTIYPFNHRAINGWTVERMLLCLFSKRPCNPVLNKKRYLVTGGGGFIGSNLVEELAKSCFVTVVDNFSTGSIKNIDTNHPAIQVFDRDITKADWLDTFEQFNGIFHLAAMSKVAPSLGNPSMINYCTDVNVLATIHILHFARQHNPPIKVVYSASSTMYGNTTELPAKESSIPDCQTPYALSKYVGELYCEQFSRQYKVPTVRLRYFMVYGPREPSSGPYAVVSGIFLQRKRVNLPLTIHGDGSQTRDFVHVHDVVKANILAMTNDTLTNTTINVGTGKNISIQQIADWISENQFHTEPRAVDLRDTLADTSTCERLLGWKPERSIQDYLLEQKGVA